MIELDVHETCDGELMAQRNEPVSPTLDECVAASGTTPLNIVIRTLNKPETIELFLRDHVLPKGSILSCDNFDTLKKLEGIKLFPIFFVINFSRKRTFTEKLRNLCILILPRTTPDFLAGITADHSYLYGRFVRFLQSRRQLVLAWVGDHRVVDHAAIILRLSHMGVNGIITSQPETALASLRRKHDCT
jgi:glycerophosphoryl diester phosphodiesterase